MKIAVTAEDIASGKARNSVHCPVALAIIRASGDATARVGYPTVYFQNARRTTQLPGAARDFVRRFDHGQPVEPFEFGLDIPAVTP